MKIGIVGCGLVGSTSAYAPVMSGVGREIVLVDPNRVRAEAEANAQFLAVNQQVAAKIEKGEPVMPPGVPKNYPDAKTLVTEDCIKPQEPSK